MMIANGLSIARLLLAPVLLLLAFLGEETRFLVVLTLAFFFDLIDGPIARHLQQVSATGAQLDSNADFAIYTVFVIGAWLLWPEVVRREQAYVACVAASIFVPVGCGILKFGRPTSLHTWMVKAAAVATAPAALVLFAGFAAWPFQLATVVCVLAAIEECAIIAVLREPRSDVKSIFHVLQS